MDIDTTTLHQELVDWVVNWNETDAAITADTPLVSSGLLDSMGLVAYVSFLEDRTGRAFDMMTFGSPRSATIRSTVQHCLKK
jgi:acyl carrier protein